jgi:tripartite-type tricarboxylate transporter receptor subunit TctC
MTARLSTLAGAAALVLAALPASVLGASQPEDYPSRNIRMVVPFAPGGPIEVVGRLIAQRLSERFGHAIVVDNRPGASGTIGADLVAKAPRDGYTLLITAQSQTINPAMYKRLPYDTLRDFAPVTQVARGYGLVLVARRSAPFKSLKALISQAKAQPGKFTFGSSGVGNSTYLAPALMTRVAGIELLHVPYKGIALALNDVIGGQIDMAFVSAVLATSMIKSDRVLGLGVGGTQRLPALPDMPTLQEQGISGFDISSWYGMWFPAGTPRERILFLQRAIATAQESADMKRRFDDIGLIPMASTPDEFSKFVREQVAYYQQVARRAGIEPL